MTGQHSDPSSQSETNSAPRARLNSLPTGQPQPNGHRGRLTELSYKATFRNSTNTWKSLLTDLASGSAS